MRRWLIVAVFAGCSSQSVPPAAPVAVAPPASEPPASTASAPAPATTPIPVQYRFLPGDMVSMRLPDDGMIFLARGDAIEEMLDAERAGSELLMARLVKEGRVVPVKSGTKGLVVKKDGLFYLVQVQEGRWKDREGWLQGELLEKWVEGPRETYVPPRPVDPQDRLPHVEDNAEHAAQVQMAEERAGAQKALQAREAEATAKREAQARATLSRAVALEKSGNRNGARLLYRDVAKRYAGTEAAREAEKRLRSWAEITW